MQLNLENELNKEADILASKLKVEGRIEKYKIKKYLINLNDHKIDFHRNKTYRLINPSISQMGKIISQNICAALIIALNINQWCTTGDCIKCLKT